MQRWEYAIAERSNKVWMPDGTAQRRQVKRTDKGVQLDCIILNGLAAEGWEVVGIASEGKYLMKREVATESD